MNYHGKAEQHSTSSAAYETFDSNNFDETSKSNSFTVRLTWTIWAIGYTLIFADLENDKIGRWMHKRNRGQITEK